MLHKKLRYTYLIEGRRGAMVQRPSDSLKAMVVGSNHSREEIIILLTSMTLHYTQHAKSQC